MQFKWKLIALTGMMMQLLTYANAQQTGDTSYRFSVKQATDYALQNENKVKAAKLDQESSLARNREVSGLALPQVTGSGSISHSPLIAGPKFPNFVKQIVQGEVKPEAINPDSKVPDEIEFAFQPKWATVVGVDVNQVVFDGAVFVALQARKTLEELATKSVTSSEIEVKANVSKAYYNVLIAEKRMDLLNDNITRIGKLLSDTREIYKNGFAEKLDVDRITVQLNNLETEKIKLTSYLQVSRNLLKFQMGMPIRYDLELTDSLDIEGSRKLLLVEQSNVIYDDRIEYSLLNTQKKLNEFDVKRYKLLQLPALSLFGNIGTNAYRDQLSFSGQWGPSSTIGIRLSVPLFDGFQRRNKVKQAQIAVMKTENDIDALRKAIDMESTQAVLNMRSNLAALDAQQKNMELATDVAGVAKKKYDEGVGSNIEVIQAEGDLKTAQTNYFSALFDAMIARIDYLKAYGKL